jgi:sulfonate transport system permease protein
MPVRLLQLVSIAALAAAWEAVARLGWVDAAFVPAPSAVAGALGEVSGRALAGLADTLTKTAIAYAIAVVVGVGLGIVVGSVRLLRDVLNPFVIAAYGIPKILILPWIMLLTGFGTTPAILYGTLHATFPIMLLVIGGVRDVDRTLITVARAYGATTWQLYGKVILPAIVPSVLAGMRLGIVFCLLGVLVVEMFAGVRGMGYVMGSLANGFKAPELFAATALVSAASIAIVLTLDWLNDRLSHWRA